MRSLWTILIALLVLSCGGSSAVQPIERVSSAPSLAIKFLLQCPVEMFLPEMAVMEAVLAFDRAEAEALVVVYSFLDRRVVGLLTEAYVLRRYAAALEERGPDPT